MNGKNISEESLPFEVRRISEHVERKNIGFACKTCRTPFQIPPSDEISVNSLVAHWKGKNHKRKLLNVTQESASSSAIKKDKSKRLHLDDENILVSDLDSSQMDDLIEENKPHISCDSDSWFCLLCKLNIPYSYQKDSVDSLAFHLNSIDHTTKVASETELSSQSENFSKKSSQYKEDLTSLCVHSMLKNLCNSSFITKVNEKFFIVEGNKFFCKVCKELIGYSESNILLEEHCKSSTHCTKLNSVAQRFVASLHVDRRTLIVHNRKLFASILEEIPIEFEDAIAPSMKFFSYLGAKFFCLLCRKSLKYAQKGRSIKKHLTCNSHKELSFRLLCNQQKKQRLYAFSHLAVLPSKRFNVKSTHLITSGKSQVKPHERSMQPFKKVFDVKKRNRNIFMLSYKTKPKGLSTQNKKVNITKTSVKKSKRTVEKSFPCENNKSIHSKNIFMTASPDPTGNIRQEVANNEDEVQRDFDCSLRHENQLSTTMSVSQQKAILQCLLKKSIYKHLVGKQNTLTICLKNFGKETVTPPPGSAKENKPQHTSGQHTLEQHTLDQYTLEQHTSEKHTSEQHTLDQYTLEQHTLEKHTSEQHTLEDKPIELSSDVFEGSLSQVSNEKSYQLQENREKSVKSSSRNELCVNSNLDEDESTKANFESFSQLSEKKSDQTQVNPGKQKPIKISSVTCDHVKKEKPVKALAGSLSECYDGVFDQVQEELEMCNNNHNVITASVNSDLGSEKSPQAQDNLLSMKNNNTVSQVKLNISENVENDEENVYFSKDKLDKIFMHDKLKLSDTQEDLCSSFHSEYDLKKTEQLKFNVKSNVHLINKIVTDVCEKLDLVHGSFVLRRKKIVCTLCKCCLPPIKSLLSVEQIIQSHVFESEHKQKESIYQYTRNTPLTDLIQSKLTMIFNDNREFIEQRGPCYFHCNLCSLNFPNYNDNIHSHMNLALHFETLKHISVNMNTTPTRSPYFIGPTSAKVLLESSNTSSNDDIRSHAQEFEHPALPSNLQSVDSIPPACKHATPLKPTGNLQIADSIPPAPDNEHATPLKPTGIIQKAGSLPPAFGNKHATPLKPTIHHQIAESRPPAPGNKHATPLKATGNLQIADSIPAAPSNEQPTILEPKGNHQHVGNISAVQGGQYPIQSESPSHCQNVFSPQGFLRPARPGSFSNYQNVNSRLPLHGFNNSVPPGPLNYCQNVQSQSPAHFFQRPPLRFNQGVRNKSTVQGFHYPMVAQPSIYANNLNNRSSSQVFQTPRLTQPLYHQNMGNFSTMQRFQHPITPEASSNYLNVDNVSPAQGGQYPMLPNQPRTPQISTQGFQNGTPPKPLIYSQHVDNRSPAQGIYHPRLLRPSLCGQNLVYGSISHGFQYPLPQQPLGNFQNFSYRYITPGFRNPHPPEPFNYCQNVNIMSPQNSSQILKNDAVHSVVSDSGLAEATSQSKAEDSCSDSLQFSNNNTSVCEECEEVFEVYNNDLDFSLQVHAHKHKTLLEVNEQYDTTCELNVDYICNVCQSPIELLNKDLQLSKNKHFEIFHPSCDQNQNLVSTRKNSVPLDIKDLLKSLGSHEEFIELEGLCALCTLCNWKTSLSHDKTLALQSLQQHIQHPYHINQYDVFLEESSSVTD